MSDEERDSMSLESKRNAGTCLALFGLLSIGAGFFALAVVIMPDLLKAVIFGAVIVGFILLHYLTWGRWLSRPRPGDLVEDEAQQGGYPLEREEYPDD